MWAYLDKRRQLPKCRFGFLELKMLFIDLWGRKINIVLCPVVMLKQ